MESFMAALKEEVKNLHENGVSLRFIGDIQAFPEKLQIAIGEAQILTEANNRMILNVAANYGGRWDIVNSCRRIVELVQEGRSTLDNITEDLFTQFLSLSELPPPDLFIRTGGEMRISNYLLWQLAYTELYFTDVLWPDFTTEHFDASVTWYSNRQRRYGRTSEQISGAGA
jgi:undecaprenyl diphosphate synthase